MGRYKHFQQPKGSVHIITHKHTALPLFSLTESLHAGRFSLICPGEGTHLESSTSEDIKKGIF